MPTIFAHAAVGYAAAKLVPRFRGDRGVIGACAALSAFPDADVLLMRWIPYEAPCGHRGLSHGIFFAAVAGVGVAAALARSRPFLRLAALLFVVTVSHGVLDAMTDGGYGIGFLEPFDHTRFFLPWTPIPVAPLGPRGLFTRYGAELITVEFALFGLFALAARVRWAATPRPRLAALLVALGVAAWPAAAHFCGWRPA